MDSKLRKLDLNSPPKHQPEELKKTKLSRSKFSLRVRNLLLGVGIILAIFFAWSTLSSSNSAFKFGLANKNSLQSTNGRVNLLLLGNAGGNHAGALLTDSIIVASYDLANHQAVYFSIPRDLWIDTAKEKINALYEIGAKDGSGLKYAEDHIGKLLGLQIPYGVVINFDGFSQAIDQVGGVDVQVEKSFDDTLYPITGKETDVCGLTEQQVDVSSSDASILGVKPGVNNVLVDSSGKVATDDADFACRYEHLHFNAGLTHMDGTTALKFVRSRHGDNGEGSDFARSKRQQLVIQAFRQKALSLQTLFNPQKLSSLINTFGQSVQTDIPSTDFLPIYSLAKDNTKVESVVLGDLGQNQSVFIHPPLGDYGGAWVLVPENNNFKGVADFVNQTLMNQATMSASPK